MARSITKDKARGIALAYCTNGFCKKDALLAVGYKEPFSKSTAGSRMFDKPIVKEAIEAITARNAEVCDVEVSEIIRGLREIAFPGPDVHVNNSDRNRALELLGKYKSLFSDRLMVGDTVQKVELDQSKRAASRQIADYLLRQGTA